MLLKQSPLKKVKVKYRVRLSTKEGVVLVQKTLFCLTKKAMLRETTRILKEGLWDEVLIDPFNREVLRDFCNVVK